VKGRCAAVRAVAARAAYLATLALGCARAAPGANPLAEHPAPATQEAGESETAYPLQLQDELGRTVVVRAEPARIVALLPSHTETLFALGVGDRVAGVDDFSDYPEKAAGLPKLGGLFDARLEPLLALKPDLVLVSETSRAVVPLEASGTTVWAGSARTFDDVFRIIETIGRIVGRPSKATEITRQMRDEINEIEKDSRGRPHPTVYFEIDRAPYAAGAVSFIGALITRAGGINIVPPDLGEFPKLGPEWLIAQNPSVILGVSREELLGRPGFAGLSAVRAGRVHTLSPDERRTIVRPGPHLAEGLRAMVHLFDPGP
jgi:iron complex transport system substrate-binding protein